MCDAVEEIFITYKFFIATLTKDTQTFDNQVSQ